MTPPINIDGTNENYSNVTIDGQDVEQITIDGQDVLSVIPDTSMFQSPIYQWAGPAIEQPDGTSPVDWPESLAELADASAVGGPTKQTQNGFESVLYDGVDDGHNWSSDVQIPTGNEPFSWAATVYLNAGGGVMAGYGLETVGQLNEFAVNTSALELQHQFFGGDSSTTSTSALPTGQFITVGGSWDGTTLQLYVNGSPDNSNTPTDSGSVQDTSHALGYERNAGDRHFDGYIHDIVLSSVTESDQAFADYHNSRLG